MAPRVTIAQGPLQGKEVDGVAAFLGIPYAAPPYGPDRFAAPVPAAGWAGVRSATDYGPTALKSEYPPPFDVLLPDPHVDGEDCLNLNIWAPLDAVGREGAGLPVLVWIHGGAFVYGSGGVAEYTGSAFARDGVVCVTVNYRLGVDGFAWIEGAPANRGLLDQVAALTWVRDNIARFGGDPDRVTIAGESAGAMSVTTLLSMPSARGLFRRVIAQSGAGQHAIGAATARRIGAHLADLLRVAPTVEGLAAVPLDKLLAAQAEVVAGPQRAPDPELWGEVTANVMAFEPVIDGDVVPVLPLHGIAAGAGSDVDLLIGTNADEQRLFVVPAGLLGVIDDGLLALAAGMWGLGPAGIDRYREAYPGDSPGELLCAIGTDWFFRIPALRVAEARAGQAGATFVYRFDWASPLYEGTLGACHALEIPFAFDTLGAGPGLASGAPQALADEMHGRWVRFVRDGDPGWPAYEPEERRGYRFAERSGETTDPDVAVRAVWDGIR